jgi:hypothetical protein
MTHSRPPTVAAWLLNHLGTTRQNDSFAGDLTEEYARGRSQAWYWRQVLLAILIGSWSEIRRHKLLALRALATGWMVIFLESRFLYPIFFRQWWSVAHSSQLLFAAPTLLWTPVSAMTGWLVGRLHRPRHIAFVLLFAVSMEVWGCQQLPWAYTLFLDSLSDSRYLPYLAGITSGLIVAPLSILIGGLYSAPKKHIEAQNQRVSA